MSINLFKIVEQLLKTNNKYISEDNKLLKVKIYEDIIRMDEQLLDILLSDNLVKETFFRKVKDTLVFDKQKFARFVESKEFLEDSYTSYINKIGLTSNGEFISNSNDIVLDFPFKDCYLYGGQDKDDQKRKEIFYNELIASDDIRQMLAPKVLGNAKRYTKNGVEEISEFDENDNLIIKGNNLIVLASLLKRYEGKVKCIYIDPPYNTGNDSFKYNDKFNHSSWLVFMKNRLELARRLLRDDGVIWVSLDDNQAHYCKVLMDDIFGNYNFVSDVIWNSTKSVTNTAIISNSHTHTLLYFKNKEYYIKNRIMFRIPEDGVGFSNPDNDPRGPWKADPFQVGGWRPNQQYEIVNPKTGISYRPNEGCSWKNEYTKFLELLNDNRIVFGVDGNSGPQRKRFLYEAKEKGKVAKTIWDDVGTTTNGTQHIKMLFDKTIFSNPKPEQFIQKIISLSTKESDIVFDFFLGSGTTTAVAHKMNRRYIGIEQMNYIQDITVERLKKVIDGEQGGISKSVNWQGGGSFVYCELLENAQQLIDEIQNANEINITEIKNKVFNDERIIPYLTTSELEKNKYEFDILDLEKKKKVLIKIIDKNKLYVNYSEIDDENYKINHINKYFTKSFYK
ncbi:DNA methyltransferase [Mycoplasma capricolum]|uniref:DNA methyltransferase n=1 Tax=Mycoplasma capricolum TaxID=2095 RepID=UPI003DA43CAA